MDHVTALLQENQVFDLEELDSLLELTSLVRNLLTDRRYGDVSEILAYITAQGHDEAFNWVMETLREEFAKADCALEDLVCDLGRSIADYDAFTQRLQVDMDPVKVDVEKVYDEHGEVQAFFNVFTYKTGYEHVYLVSCENFDTKDNDYIQYQLLLTREELRL